MDEWIQKYHVHKLTRYIDTPNNLCFWACLALWKNAGSGSSCYLVAEAKLLLKNSYSFYVKKYEGLSLKEISSIAAHFDINILVYTATAEEENIICELSNDLSSVDKERKECINNYVW
ncbi:hypothetical protein FACS189472_07960 [Alphaproteobacteria bacterium]|nr:hypothetical protein FACS189472_07960 [Alphaproteobacteria bacterium]